MTWDSNQDYTAERVMEMAIEQRLFDLHTAMPGTVESYDPATETCTVRPDIKRKWPDGTIVDLPLVLKCPVMFPGTGDAQISFPLNRGDKVTILWMERSIEEWRAATGTVKPKDPRRFDLADAFVFPGGRRPSKPSGTSSGSALRITFAKSIIELTQDGKIRLSNGTSELVDLVMKLADEVKAIATSLKTDTTNTGIGPQPLNGATAYGTSGDKAGEISGKLGGMKG